jgi:hypothetical protein
MLLQALILNSLHKSAHIEKFATLIPSGPIETDKRSKRHRALGANLLHITLRYHKGINRIKESIGLLVVAGMAKARPGGNLGGSG